MNRDEQEMALWLRIYERWYSREVYDAAECGDVADYAVEQFRKRYPVEPTAPEAVWYDEPPFPKDGESYPCWVDGEQLPAAVYFDRDAWYVMLICELYPSRLAGRRVCPIVKPQEPPQ